MSNKKKNKKQRKPKTEGKQILQKYPKNLQMGVKDVTNDTDNKLSEVILNFTQPLLEKCASFKDKEKMVSFACFVWNICLIPPEEAEKARNDLYSKICKGDKLAIDDMNEIMGYLIARKQLKFKDDRRLIVSYNISKTENLLKLDVIHTQIS